MTRDTIFRIASLTKPIAAAATMMLVDDYHPFCRMLLNMGAQGSRQLLSEASVRAMTRDQLTPAQREGTEVFLGAHSSWGFGVAVDTARAEPWNVPGRFGWVGGLGTSAYSDPANDFIGAVFTQRLMDSPESGAVFTDFWKHAYRALDA